MLQEKRKKVTDNEKTFQVENKCLFDIMKLSIKKFSPFTKYREAQFRGQLRQTSMQIHFSFPGRNAVLHNHFFDS